MNKRICLAITIDTECDKGAKWKVKQPLSFTNVHEGIKNNLQPIFDKYNVQATYLLSPEVMMDEKSVAVFKNLGDKVELGTHLHSEFIEPHANFTAVNTKHYQKDYDPDIERAKLENLTDLFIDRFGYKPLSFRAGRFGISLNTLSILQDLGYEVDSSVTPDMHWNNTYGSSVNFFGAPYQPYYPSINDFRREGDLKILQFPVTLINEKIARLPLWLKRRIRLERSYQHIAFNLSTNFSNPVWLRPTFSSIEAMKHVTNRFMKITNKDDLFLCMMFHSNEFEINTSPYSLNKEAMAEIISRLDDYLEWITATKNVTFSGLTHAKAIFDND